MRMGSDCWLVLHRMPPMQKMVGNFKRLSLKSGCQACMVATSRSEHDAYVLHRQVDGSAGGEEGAA